MATFDAIKVVIQEYAKSGALKRLAKLTKVKRKHLELWLNGRYTLTPKERRRLERKIGIK